MAADRKRYRLERAAPEMLAALESIMADFVRIGSWGFSGDSLISVRAAIAKATGESA